MLLPRPINRITILGVGASIYDWVVNTYETYPDQGEIWTINSGAAVFRHDVVFDMHTDEWIEGLKPAVGDRIKRRRAALERHDKPIYMPKALPSHPTSVAYPLNEIIEKTGSAYFSTGMAYVVAMALCCEPKEVTFWGCDFSYRRDTNTHDEQGRACCEYWVGRLVGAGCKVGYSQNTHFMDMAKRTRGQIYGFHESPIHLSMKDGKGQFVPADNA